MALTDAKIRAAKPDTSRRFELADGNGLALVILPTGSRIWRLRYLAPDGKRKRVSLGKYPDVSLANARIEAAKHRGKIVAGGDPAAERTALRAQSVTLAEVVAQYISENQPTWKDGTARTYLSAIRAFLAWATSAKVKSVNDLDPEQLAKYRAHAIKAPRRTKAKGGSRRDVASTGEPRSSASVNRDLRATKTMLQSLRKAGRLPAIPSSDAITDNLGLLSVDRERPDPLKPAQIAKLFGACTEHDAVNFKITREEHDGHREAGTTTRHEPISALAAVMVLGGFRLGEALTLTWQDVDLEQELVRVLPGKTGHERTVDLSVSPGLVRLFAAMRTRSTGEGPVFRHNKASARAARKRLIEDHGAPDFLWSTRNSRPGERSAPTLRSTCGCYLTCAPSIFHGASVYRSAAQLGHSVQVAEKHYLGTLTKIPKDATTIEAAMQIEAEIDALISRLGEP